MSAPPDKVHLIYGQTESGRLFGGNTVLFKEASRIKSQVQAQAQAGQVKTLFFRRMEVDTELFHLSHLANFLGKAEMQKKNQYLQDWEKFPPHQPFQPLLVSSKHYMKIYVYSYKCILY